MKNIWAAFHASRQQPNAGCICPTSLLPLFMECAHTVAMIRHSMDVVKNAVEHMNPGQTPVITFDQPLFALAKQIQWKWPDSYGEDHIVVMFGGLHIEMAALKTLGDWLKGSGWVQALVQAEIATAGTADSFLRASHVLRTRRAHQVTAAALYILQHHAYNRFCLEKKPEKQRTFPRLKTGVTRDETTSPVSLLGNCAGTRIVGSSICAFSQAGIV
ncbi:uncharacterized protein LOC103506659, partial [Caligus rogercresseyi]